MNLPIPTLEPVFDVTVILGPLEDHGITRFGHRRVVPIVGGSVSGLFDAEILPGGADWQVVRPDGAIEVDARYTARTAGDEFVLIHASGLRTGDPAVLESLLKGEIVEPGDYYFRTVLRLETSAPGLRHLEHSVFVASALREADGVRYRAYRVS